MRLDFLFPNESKGERSGACRGRLPREWKLNCADKSFNRKSNCTRTRVKHAFAVIKNLWGCRRVRCRRLAKNAWQVYTLLALANFCMARKQSVVC